MLRTLAVPVVQPYIVHLVSTKHIVKSHMVSLGYAYLVRKTSTNPTREMKNVDRVWDDFLSTMVKERVVLILIQTLSLLQ